MLLSNNGNCAGYFDKSLHKFVYTTVDTMPLFPNGNAAFLNLFLEDLKYPVQEYIQGRVVLEFVIDTNGEIIKKEIYGKRLKDYTEIDKAALSTLGKLPKWIPGRCNYKNVVTKFIFPIRF